MSDRIVTRLLRWIAAIIGRANPDAPTAPLFTTLSEQRWGNGILRRININPAVRPAAVEAFVFIPYRHRGQPIPMDCLLVCDLLEGRGRRLEATHYVTVLLLPHFAKDLGQVEILYSAAWDLQRGQYRNYYVLCIMQRCANELRIRPPESVDWHDAIGRARAECWGGVALPPPPPKLPLGNVFIEPYDPGTKRVRVRMQWAALWVAWLMVDG